MLDLITKKEENDILEKIKFIKASPYFNEKQFIEYLSKTLSETEVNKYLALMETVK